MPAQSTAASDSIPTLQRSGAGGSVLPALGRAAGLLAAAWLLASQPLAAAYGAAAASAGMLILVRWPWFIWPVFGALLPFSSAIKLGPLSASELLLAAACLLWLAEGAQRRTLVLRVSAPLLLLLPFAALLALTMLSAPDLGEAGKEVIKWLELLVIFLLLDSILSMRRARALAVGLLLGACLQASLGLYQFIFRIGPDWFVVLDRFMRASGTFRQPNPYAGYLGLMLPAAVSFCLWSWGAFFRTSAARGTERSLAAAGIGVLFYTASAALIAAGLLASWSRGGWLGALAGVGAVLFLRSRRTLLAGLLFALALIALLLLESVSPQMVPAPLLQRIGELPASLQAADVLSQPVTDANFSVVERIAHWIAALRMWEQAPWLGIGPGNYAVVYSQVRLPQWEEALGHAHNVYLNVLGESGLVGLTAFLLFWLGLAVWVARHLWEAPEGSWERALTVGVLGMLLHATVHNLVDNIFVQGITLQIALWVGVLSAVERNRQERGPVRAAR